MLNELCYVGSCSANSRVVRFKRRKRSVCLHPGAAMNGIPLAVGLVGSWSARHRFPLSCCMARMRGPNLPAIDKGSLRKTLGCLEESKMTSFGRPKAGFGARSRPTMLYRPVWASGSDSTAGRDRRGLAPVSNYASLVKTVNPIG